MTDLWNYLKLTEKPIVLYGMGNGADKIIEVLKRYGIKIEGVFATDGFVRNKVFHGFPVVTFGELEKSFGEMIVLLCFGSAREEVISNIINIASRQELYAPDVPVYGNVIFDFEYAKKHAHQLESVYELLADETSKRTFENTVRYKLCGDIKWLFDCETCADEPYNSFLKLSDNETFLDLGAYRGDTVGEFIKRTKNYNCIYAVEPDFKNFRKLEAFIGDFANTKAVNACISDFCGKKSFSMNGSRGSFSGSVIKSREIESITIDSLLNECKCTFIKMDIEGEETAAVRGATDTIRQLKPKMMISCYHRSEDLINIPIAVLDIRKDYKIYMRHFRSLPAWDTAYYFV